MVHPRGDHEAFGAPGSEPRWARGDKSAVGTAYAPDSRLWFTLWRGIVSEVYAPTVDSAQVRDCQLLVWDDAGGFQEEQRDLEHRVEPIDGEALGYRVRSRDPAGRYVIHKEIIAHPHLPCLLQRLRIEGDDAVLDTLRLAVLCAPQLMGGTDNAATVYTIGEQQVLTADKDGCWLVLGASRPFARCSCGYVGASDGWSDLATDGRLDWSFDRASRGNVALLGELPMAAAREGLTLVLALGEGRQHAMTAMLEAAAASFDELRARFVAQWERARRERLPLERVAGDGGRLFRHSWNVLLAHEDKTYAGGLVASLAMPWGQLDSSERASGYHVVWCRDMVHSAIGLLAAGDRETPRRALLYLMAAQRADGGFPQNFWIDGREHGGGIQLDEVAMPILLARQLERADALGGVDPLGMVREAAAFLVRHGPATQEERWEEASGYSPSTLASSIAALICAAGMLRRGGAGDDARFLEDYADFLECHLERWTVTRRGRLHPGIARHYIRILPAPTVERHPDADPDAAVLGLANQPPWGPREYEARDIVDAGFLELVRYGIRRADDPLIVDSLRVVDAVLRVDLPCGPCWRRYNHDGYGQRDDGSPFEGWGRGRPWPLLTAERALYELAVGGDPRPLLATLERIAGERRLLPEQVWDGESLPERDLHPGGPTGSAMPLCWAHALYLVALRSVADGAVFEFLPEVFARYCGAGRQRRCRPLQIWKPQRRPDSVRAGERLRFQAPEPFVLRWSGDDWRDQEDRRSIATGLGLHYVDLQIGADRRGTIRAAIHWCARDEWEEAEQRLDVLGT